MMQSRSIARELALLVLGQIPDDDVKDFPLLSFEVLLQRALDSLVQYWRESLDKCASELDRAQQHLLDSELHESDKNSITRVRGHLRDSLVQAENLLNGLSTSLDLPRLLALSDQKEIREGAMNRVSLVVEQRQIIDARLDGVMEGWRLRRLPRIDRDILRLAVIDLNDLHTPPAVACNEAVDLANRYSDEQGRRMINGVLRRLQNAHLTAI